MSKYDFESVAKTMERVFEECRALRAAGHKEYAHDSDNPFRNFESLSSALDLPREKILWVYAQKHIDGIAAHIKGHRSQREDVRGRINDLIVYLVLLRAMEDEGSDTPAGGWVEVDSASLTGCRTLEDLVEKAHKEMSKGGLYDYEKPGYKTPFFGDKLVAAREEKPGQMIGTALRFSVKSEI